MVYQSKRRAIAISMIFQQNLEPHGKTDHFAIETIDSSIEVEEEKKKKREEFLVKEEVY